MVDDVEVVTITDLLYGHVVEKNSNVVGEENLQDINVTASEGLNHEIKSENVNVEIEPGDISDLEEEWVGSNQESSDDSQEDVIPNEDDSEVDEELRSLRNERKNKMFPIAWAVVDTETKHNWSFFLNYLIEDLNLGTGHGLTVLSDMQKLYVSCYQIVSREGVLGIYGPTGIKYRILPARHKTIMIMLEEIRHKIMDRNIAMRQFIETWISDISPMARLVLEENKDLARLCEVRFNGDIGYEILDGYNKKVCPTITGMG
ncbi:hypothetical protein RDI58_016426 [Solanum bulbocastanum]|uniref:Uncharacterized protein n=1 Tax=Solanum bulbocastanum TaxID=147425 RepID=A0AAN8YDR3_SOLBU